MSKYQKTEEGTEWKPSAREANDLSEKLKAFPKKEVNGRMQYPFELYLENQGVISFDQFGRIKVKIPLQYHRLNEINSLREWIQHQEQEKLFQAFPEELVAWELRIDSWMASCREVIGRFKVKSV